MVLLSNNFVERPMFNTRMHNFRAVIGSWQAAFLASYHSGLSFKFGSYNIHTICGFSLLVVFAFAKKIILLFFLSTKTKIFNILI